MAGNELSSLDTEAGSAGDHLARHEGERARAVLETLPGAVFVIDELGIITLATDQAGRLVGVMAADVVGTSVLEYVDPEASWAYAAAMDFAMSETYVDDFSGPVRIDVRSVDGRRIATDLWTANRLEDPAVQGVVCLLTPQTAALGLAEAIAAAGAGAPFSEVAAAVTVAMAGFPVTAACAVLRCPAPGADFEVVATNEVAGPLVDGTAGDTLWRQAIETAERVVAAEPTSMPAGLVDLALAAGHQSVWAQPVLAPGVSEAGAEAEAGAPIAGAPMVGDPEASEGGTGEVVVLFRPHAAEPTPNELSYVHQAAAVLALSRLRPEPG